MQQTIKPSKQIATMKYREKLLQLITEGTAQEFQEWLISQPALDQPAIMRELKQLGNLPPEEGGVNLLDTLEGFNAYDKVIDKYEDAILDQKLAKQQVIMAEEALTKHVQQMRQTHPNLREHVIGSILKKEPNAALLRSLAQVLIALEKMDNSYNPENWKQLPEL
ncbi:MULTISPECIES: hypothetical protein [Aequorivita]|uniref:Uncharacterized protein n=1 Tax=Aequorivita iocasae TaxID=2803865 RepID=A0ABX7DRF5_9FLAO|nr:MULTISPECIES: hypothetical protein [Aequorivita]QQX76390.1 hypothetical protein JK629_13835 [Aequorivita iocasae]UCA55859.1 hypothetical protein LDL78_13905 [Aequorivita sp. F7]